LNPIPEEPIPKHDILLAYKPEEIIVTFKPKENNSRASDHSTSEEEIQTKTIVKPVIKKISHNKFQNKPEKKKQMKKLNLMKPLQVLNQNHYQQCFEKSTIQLKGLIPDKFMFNYLIILLSILISLF